MTLELSGARLTNTVKHEHEHEHKGVDLHFCIVFN